MKRLFAILLVLCLVLCGCDAGSNTPTQPDTPGQTAEPTRPAEVEPIEVDGAALCVTVTINPKFELYLDLFNEILEVRAQNEDAQKLLADLQVVGKPYSEGIMEILAEAEQQGFLQNRAKLSIATKELVEGGWNHRSETTLLDPVEAYKAASGLTMTCELYPARNPHAEITSVHTNKRDGYREEICYDITDRHILTRMYFDDGSYWETDWVQKTSYRWDVDGSYSYEDWKDGFSSSYTIHPDGTVDRVMRTVDNLGNRTDWELFLYADGSSLESFYDKSGNLIKSISTYSDGSSSESLYENGECVQTIYKNADGTVSREEGDAEGILTGTNSDGSTYEMANYPNGNIKTSNKTWSNGDYCNQTYYENGNLETDIQFRDGRYVEQYFDENGLLTSIFQRDPDGTEYAWDYEKGIAVGVAITYPNGDYCNQTYYENGNLETGIEFRDGRYVEQYCDENGLLTSIFQRDPDGTEYDFDYENGEAVGYTVTYPDGTSEYHSYAP